MKKLIRMYNYIHFWLFPLILICLGLTQNVLSCPHPCACYVKTEVHCTFRSLATVPGRIPKHVERINLGFNSIQSIAENSFVGLSKLEMLLIHSNDVHNVPNGAFKDLVSLQVFKMSYNKLNVVSSHTFHGLSSLTRLHVDHNKIEFIHPNAFNGLASLRLLHLEGNLIQQLHANTFCTFNFLDLFRQSTLKHLYLSENNIKTLPAAMMKTMPLLESLYLHGNPWECDCRLNWFPEWNEKFNGVLKCKKDRAYENGQLCALCVFPKQLQNQEIQSIKDFTCSSPIIYSSLKANSSDVNTEEKDKELAQSYESVVGKIILNMTDEHGNKVNLDCEMKKTNDFSKIHWSQPHPEEIDINATFALDLECPMNRENYEKLWKLIAYYSEVPAKLEKELIFSTDPKVTYRYRQNMDHDSYYYTGVKALIIADPSWVMQSFISLQLNRKKSTARKVTLSFSTQYSQSVHTKEIRYPRNNWVMIDKNEKTKTSISVVKGEVCQLICNVKSSETPSIEWSLPDGTKLKAPYSSLDGRFSISTNGHLVIKMVDITDSGEYHCIAQVKHETDILVFRVEVQPPVSEVSQTNMKVISKSVGEPITLDCNVFANPDADVHWILPNNNVIDSYANKTSAYFLNNGSLKVLDSKLTDGGIYRCIAINQYGTDLYSLQVAIHRKGSDQVSQPSKIKKRPVIVLSARPKHNVIDDDGGSGEKNTQEEADIYSTKEKARLSKNKSSHIYRNNGKQARKERRKMKTQKNVEIIKGSNIAEGRRKFESRRRINMGNNKIDPKQWANILAKVRGKNIQKTTDSSPLMTTKATTKPTLKKKTPPSIARPPLDPSKESEIIEEEASADGSHINEDELLIVTYSPQITVTHNSQDVPSLPKTEEKISDDALEKNNEESFTIQSPGPLLSLGTSNPKISTLDEDVSVYSAKEEEIESSSTELEDKGMMESIINTVNTDRAYQTSVPITKGQYFVDYSTIKVNKIIPAVNTMDMVDLNEVESYSTEMATVHIDETTQYSAVKTVTKSPSPYDFIQSSIAENIENQFMQHSTGTNYKTTLQSNAFFTWADHAFMPSTTTREYGTTTTIKNYEQNMHNRMESMIPKANVIPTPIDTPPVIDPSVPTTNVPITDDMNPSINGLGTTKYKEEYAEKTESFNSDINEKSIVSFNNINTNKGYRINKVSAITFKGVTTKPYGFFTSAENAMVPTTDPHKLTSLSPKQEISTFINTHRKFTTPLYPAKNNNQYPRRRPNGRRRIRPNRFRHRQNQVVPTLPGTIQANIETVIQKPKESVSEGKTPIKTHFSQTQFSDRIFYPTTNNAIFSTTTLSPVTKLTTNPARMLALPPTISTTETTNKYSTGHTTQLYTLKTAMKNNDITIYNVQTTEPQDKTFFEKGEPAASTTIDENKLTPGKKITLPSWDIYTEYGTRHQQESTDRLHSETEQTDNTEQAAVTEKIVSLTDPMSTTNSILKDVSYTQNILPAITTTKQPAITTVPWHHTRETTTIANSKRNMLYEATEIDDMETTSLENKNTLFVYEGKKEGTTRLIEYMKRNDPVRIMPETTVTKKSITTPVEYTVRPKPVKPIPVAPVTKKSTTNLVEYTIRPQTNKPILVIPVTKKSTTHLVDYTISPQTAKPKPETLVTKKSITNFAEYTIRPEPAKPIPVAPVVKESSTNEYTIKQLPAKAMPLTTPFYSTTTGTQSFLFHTTKGLKEQVELINQVEPTKASRFMQTSIPSPKQNDLEHISLNQNGMFIKQKQDNLKDTFSAKSNNSLYYNTRFRHQPRLTQNNQHHSAIQRHYNPFRGTMRTPYFGSHGPLRYFITNPPISMTNKPEITAYTAQSFQERKTNTPQISTTTPTTTTTTTVIPLFRPKPITPSRFNQQGQRIPTRSFGNNLITEGKHIPARIPYQGNPYYMNPRIQYRFNRTKNYFTFTYKPFIPTLFAPSGNKDSARDSFSKTTTSSAIIRATDPLVHLSTTTLGTTTKNSFTKQPNITTPSYTMQALIPPPSTSIQNWNTYHHNRTPQTGTNTQYSKVRNSNVLQPPENIRPQSSKPKITTTDFQSLSVPFEMDAVFPCEAVGEPKPVITWTKISTGAVISKNTRMQRFEVLENGTLHIQNLQLQDRGQYLCAAENQLGTDKMLITLTVVAQQPKILGSRYKDVTVYLGDIVTMDCNASGVPSAHISWILPDRKIIRTVSATEGRVMLFNNGTLSIKDTTFTDRGIFKCVASNVAGADSLTVRVHIAALPPIIQQDKMENISIPQSHSIYIHCSAKGAPLPSIRWVLHDGTQVRPSQLANGNVFVFPNGTLYIRNISPKDNGKYECITVNIVGTARRTVILDVKKYSSNAKITASSPQKTDVSYGSTLRLDCSAAGDPWPRILWRLPSKRLVDSFFSFDARIKTFANGTLIIYSVTEKDAGDYLCMARNKIGDDYVVLKVNVMMKPAKIQYKNEVDHKVIYGGDLKVDCIATGVPNPEISWSLPDGSMVNNVMQSDDSGTRTRRYLVFNNGTLYFNEVGMKEEGDYTCYAINQIGQDEMRVSVKVVAEKAIIKNKTYSTVNVPYGDVVTVPCEAKGEPVPKITWLSPANRPIPALSDKYQVYKDGTLLIQKAQRSDSGNYTCLAQNNAGEDKKIVHIQVNILPPKINGYSNKIVTIKENAMKDSHIQIDCKAEGIPSPRVMWVFPEGVILPAPYYGNRITVHRNGTLEIKVLRKSDSVQLVCIGRNEGGEARLIVQLTVSEPAVKPVFHTENENIVVAEGQVVNLNCSPEGIPEPMKIWILPNGTELQSGNHLHRFYHKQDGILYIGTASIADAGTYRCRATNIAGFADKLVNLQIGHKPQMNNRYNNLVSIINGETLQLHCTTHGTTHPHITWTLPSGVVLDGPQSKGRFSLLQNGTLVVRETSVYDRGSYVCKATTQYGSSTMNVPVIIIAYPPRITTSPAPVIYARLGSSIQLNCMSIGIPKAEITWELPDKSHLTAGAQSRLYGNKFLHPQGTLVIQQPSQRDVGYYKCTAKNILGSDTKTTYLHIY
ncbi:matrix-remodeling-associated protein 5 [Bombina bombina]|uniref:matrix-remodeling-associated protein 5 n=1 Tax=Bombina bombina TaxID=8345 RepID=UPI00235A9196|nr:matrix-remodeling-associated protein 5 [Bombina bombina]